MSGAIAVDRGLFEPVRLGALQVRNRFVQSATYEQMAGLDGEVTPELIERYRRLAEGEVGLVVPGFMFVQVGGRALKRQIGIHDDRLVPGLAELVRAVHDAGGAIAFQIGHAGRQASKKATGRTPIAPSGFGRTFGTYERIATATEGDIEEVIAAFGSAARRARDAGADAVQIHCAHGYLLSEFLSPYFNRRRDGWGGSAEARFRIVREVLAAVRQAVGPDVAVLAKINTDDYTPEPGVDLELATRHAAWLAEAGIDGLEISSGTYFTFHITRGEIPIEQLAAAVPFWARPLVRRMLRKNAEPCRFEHVYHLRAAEAIKPAIGEVPLILVGGVRRLADMERAVAGGAADLLSLSRPFVREPALVRRLREGRVTEASCTSCNRCLAGAYAETPLRCQRGTA